MLDQSSVPSQQHPPDHCPPCTRVRVLSRLQLTFPIIVYADVRNRTIQFTTLIDNAAYVSFLKSLYKGMTVNQEGLGFELNHPVWQASSGSARHITRTVVGVGNSFNDLPINILNNLAGKSLSSGTLLQNDPTVYVYI